MKLMKIFSYVTWEPRNWSKMWINWPCCCHMSCMWSYFKWVLFIRTVVMIVVLFILNLYLTNQTFAGSEFLSRNAAQGNKSVFRRVANANCFGSCSFYRAWFVAAWWTYGVLCLCSLWNELLQLNLLYI